MAEIKEVLAGTEIKEVLVGTEMEEALAGIETEEALAERYRRGTDRDREIEEH